MIYLDDTLTEDELREAADEQRRNRLAGILRACFAIEHQYGLGSPEALKAWHTADAAVGSYSRSRQRWPVSSRCERGAHGDCMQGAWCLCPCHEQEH